MGSLLDLLPVGDGLDVLDDIVVQLIALALLCSDASLAYAQARLGKRRALQLIGGLQSVPASHPAGDWAAADGYRPAVASASRSAVMYAGAATRLAWAAVPIAAGLATGRPAVTPQQRPLVPSDVIRMPQRHVPLIQFPVDCGPTGPGVVEVNADLAAHHRQLRVSIDRLLAGGGPPTVFDVDRCDMPGIGPADVGGGFPAALHAYGGDCVWAVTLLRGLATGPVH
jgi:hypothetical protein